MFNNRLFFRGVLACILTGLLGCDDGGSSSGGTTAQPLPTEFTDVHGTLWACPRASATGELRGEAVLNPTNSIRRADILHLSLVAEQAGELQLVSALCINNLTRSDVNFTLPYDPALVQPDARYFLSANYFSPTETDQYQLTLAPDGLTEVFKEGSTESVRLILNPL